ncbi:MAG TPA: hypothetical protein IAB57_06550 [Candidatus Fimivivens faecavium]|nr:hypothetical protein [Candidatus Fimivivens faecavium]
MTLVSVVLGRPDRDRFGQRLRELGIDGLLELVSGDPPLTKPCPAFASIFSM